MLERAMMASFVQGLWKVMQMERKQVNGLIFLKTYFLFFPCFLQLYGIFDFLIQIN